MDFTFCDINLVSIFQIELQNNRLKQAQERKDADIAAAADRFKNSLGGGSKYDEAVKKAKELELSVASRVQREIIKIQDQLTKDLKAIDTKYEADIKAIQDRIQKLRNQANVKTEDIDSRITLLENNITKEQVKVDGFRNEKFSYEKEYRKLEAENEILKVRNQRLKAENQTLRNRVNILTKPIGNKRRRCLQATKLTF